MLGEWKWNLTVVENVGHVVGRNVCLSQDKPPVLSPALTPCELLSGATLGPSFIAAKATKPSEEEVAGFAVSEKSKSIGPMSSVRTEMP